MKYPQEMWMAVDRAFVYSGGSAQRAVEAAIKWLVEHPKSLKKIGGQ